MTRIRKWGKFARTDTVENVLEQAMAEISTLAEEMSSWRDNLESSDGLSATSKYEMVGECADALENVDIDIKVPAGIDSAAKITYFEILKRGDPRHIRLSNAIAILEAIVEHLNSLIDSATEGAEMDDIEEFRDEVESIADELGNVEFPSMFG